MGVLSKLLPWLTLGAMLIPGLQWWAIAGIVVAGSLLSANLTEDVDMPSYDAAAAGGAGLRANTRSTQEAVKVLYGQLRVGGNDVYMGTSGADNKILWIVQTLSEGECDSIAQVTGVDQVFLADLLYNQYGGNVSYWFHAGSASQTVDTNLNGALAEWTDTLRYTAYMVWKLTYDRDYFQSLPKRTVVLRGKRVYDFRDTAAEKIVNGDMELDSNWADVSTPVVNVRSSEQKHGGTYSRKFTVDQPYEGIRSDDFTTVTGVRYTIGFWVYPTDTNSIRMGAYRGDAGGWNDGKDFDGLTLNAWNYVEWSYTEIAGGNGAYVAIVSKEGISSGTWYIDDVTSKAFGGSSNPVLALYDYMTNDRYGIGIASAKFDTGIDSSWRSAADYCDTKNWMLNMAINKDQAAQDILDAICAHFRGELVWWDGKFYLRYADLNDESSCMTVEDKHVFQDEDGKAAIAISEPSRFKKPDGIRVKYTDPDRDYIIDDFIIGDETGYIKELKLIGAFRQQAADLGVYYLEREKLDRAVTGQFRDDALKLEPHDIITLNSTALSISSQLMRVLEANILDTNLIELILLYEQLSLYDDDYNFDAEGTYQCSLPDPTAEPPSVSSVQVSEETYNYRLRTFTRLKVSFNKPTNYAWYDHVEVRISYDDTNWEHLFDCTTDFEIDPVEEGITYYIRLKVVSIWGTKQQDSNDYKTSRTIGGYTNAPASLSSLKAIVNANTINLYAEKVSDPDVELYEFRLGSSWSGGIFLAALRSPNLSLSGVKPGNHTFLANTLGNNGLYGSVPRSAGATLKDPPDGWTVQATETCDYDGIGTHNNTEHTIYNTEDYLKCSHSGSLVGTYTSPIYDRGSSARYMVYLLADIVVTGAGTTWNDVIPSPDTWNNINIDTRTWIEIFELAAGPSVSIKLKYGETSPPTSVVEKQEILSAIVTGRYFQVEITITDPSDAINALVEHFTLKFCQ